MAVRYSCSTPRNAVLPGVESPTFNGTQKRRDVELCAKPPGEHGDEVLDPQHLIQTKQAGNRGKRPQTPSRAARGKLCGKRVGAIAERKTMQRKPAVRRVIRCPEQGVPRVDDRFLQVEDARGARVAAVLEGHQNRTPPRQVTQQNQGLRGGAADQRRDEHQPLGTMGRFWVHHPHTRNPTLP